MNYKEELLWILDDPKRKSILEADHQRNIDFVHSLGLKCDCVGWSKLDLSDPRTEEILEAIAQFCKETGWKGRCLYTRTCLDMESDWYVLMPDVFESTDGFYDVAGENGGKLVFPNIRAYQESRPGPKVMGGFLFVPDRFRKACLDNGISGLDFCWVRDKGKYEAEQYFAVFAQQQIPGVGLDWNLEQPSRKDLKDAGGYLPRLGEVFDTFQQINLPDCYLADDMPEGGIAYAYVSRKWSGSCHDILIHKDAAHLLLEQRAVSPKALRPAPVLDKLPGGYIRMKTEPVPCPSRECREQMQREYEKLLSKPRPVRKVSEKEALKVLRKAKTGRKEDFQKRLPKARAESLADSAFALLLPYYLVTAGGYLSDEYELLTPEAAQEASREFAQEIAAEELLESKPDGIVIAKCPDGDKVLLCKAGTVIRISHEAPEIEEQWPSLAQFVFDVVTESV